MLLEIWVKASFGSDVERNLNIAEMGYVKMTVLADYIQSVAQMPDNSLECSVGLMDGEYYVVNMSYDEMVNFWRKSMEMSNESYIVKTAPKVEKETGKPVSMN